MASPHKQLVEREQSLGPEAIRKGLRRLLRLTQVGSIERLWRAEQTAGDRWSSEFQQCRHKNRSDARKSGI